MTGEPISLDDLAALARSVLPPHVWDFFDGGAQDEVTLGRNRRALDAVALRGRFLRDVAERDLSVEVLGQRLDLPVIIAPMRGHRMLHPEGEIGTALGAADAGTILTVSTVSSDSIEDIRDATPGPLWFQLYHMGRAISEMLVRRAEDAGYAAICVTVDAPVANPIARSVRHGSSLPPGFSSGNFVGALAGLGIEQDGSEAMLFRPPDAIPFTWDDFRWLRSITSLPIVLKGIHTPEDAVDCVTHGVDAIVVSNHGARQIDGTRSSIEMLPDVAQAVGSSVEVYLDSGIRRGTDVVKALSLGARAVLVGRPIAWGLAWSGAAGVRRALEILRSEIDRAMAICGTTTPAGLDIDAVELPWAFDGIPWRRNISPPTHA
jgi:4-hydroxymandelate oxidase